MSGILSGKAIAQAVEDGSIRIDPYAPEQLNPASYDLTLGDDVVTYFGPAFNTADEWKNHRVAHDVADPPNFQTSRILPSGIVVRPGVGYLLHTRERVSTDKYVPVLDGKSSIGRLFISVHQTAGYGDPGFDGQYTLELTTLYPIRLRAGMRVAQIRFHELVGEPTLYRGQYRGATSIGAVPSRAWKQFEGKK